MIETEPDRWASMDWPSLLKFSVRALNLSPTEFWKLTFAEFWPLHDSVMGKTVKPMTFEELEALEADWIGKGATDGNS